MVVGLVVPLVLERVMAIHALGGKTISKEGN